MNLHAWAEHRARYSRAKHGRNDRGASLVECALISGMAQAKAVEGARAAARRAAAVAAPTAAEPSSPVRPAA